MEHMEDTKSPVFFVPGAKEGKDEDVYRELANFAKTVCPKEGDRVYSITFQNRSETWTATVGESLQGMKDEFTQRGDRLSLYERRVSDPAIVVAIFPSAPYVVVTDHCLYLDAKSAWENPIRAGNPENIVYFSKQK